MSTIVKQLWPLHIIKQQRRTETLPQTQVDDPKRSLEQRRQEQENGRFHQTECPKGLLSDACWEGGEGGPGRHHEGHGGADVTWRAL